MDTLETGNVGMTNSQIAVGMTADLLSAYLGNNALAASELPSLIASTHAAFVKMLDGGEAKPEPESDPAQKMTPAQISKSITPDALISFIDGKPYKTLKRHLAVNGLSPEEYRRRYGLSSGYPMVCASYSATRSDLAKSFGLGRGTKPKSNGVVAH